MFPFFFNKGGGKPNVPEESLCLLVKYDTARFTAYLSSGEKKQQLTFLESKLIYY